MIAHNPDPILNSLTNEIVEVGSDGEEVRNFIENIYKEVNSLIWFFSFQVTKVEPAVTVEMKHALVKRIRNFIEIIGAVRVLSPLDSKAFNFEDLD